MSDLEEALNGALPESEQVETPEPETEASAEVEAQPEAPKGEQVASPPEADDVAAFKAKALDETRKRQALEQELQALRTQASQPQEKPDFWQDPDQAISQIMQQMDGRIKEVSTNMSVEFMRTVHSDYDEMEASFVDMAKQNPALIAQMNQSGNPAKFAYDYAKTQQQVAEMQDPNYRDKLKAELLKELEAEKGAQIEEEIRKRTELPGSLANDRAAGGNTATTNARPDLQQLIGN